MLAQVELNESLPLEPLRVAALKEWFWQTFGFDGRLLLWSSRGTWSLVNEPDLWFTLLCVPQYLAPKIDQALAREAEETMRLEGPSYRAALEPFSWLLGSLTGSEPSSKRSGDANFCFRQR